MSEREPHVFQELSTSELVDKYIAISKGKTPPYSDFTNEEAGQYEGVKRDTNKLIQAVELGMVSPEDAERVITNFHLDFAGRFPEKGNTVLFIQMFAQAKIWMADARRELREEETLTAAFRTSMDKAARLLLGGDILAGYRNPYISVFAFRCLISAGMSEDAIRLAENCFAGLVVAENVQEARMLAKSLGEKDHSFFEAGIALVDPAKIDPRNN